MSSGWAMGALASSPTDTQQIRGLSVDSYATVRGPRQRACEHTTEGQSPGTAMCAIVRGSSVAVRRFEWQGSRAPRGRFRRDLQACWVGTSKAGRRGRQQLSRDSISKGTVLRN